MVKLNSEAMSIFRREDLINNRFGKLNTLIFAGQFLAALRGPRRGDY
jgi:hypothetical protein